MKDTHTYDLIEKEKKRQQTTINLIASENYVSCNVLEALGSVFTNKYSEGYPGKRYYSWQQYVDEIEMLAIERTKHLFWGEYVNVQPLSGACANIACYVACLKEGDTILSLRLDHGGHLTHGAPVSITGKWYQVYHYGVDPVTERISYEEVEYLARTYKPKMIIAGFSSYSRNIDWKIFSAIAKEVGALLLGDVSHIAGLIAGKVLENPVKYCDVITMTTHKTLRWPRGAIIISRGELSKPIAQAVFPWIQWGPHEHVIAAKSVALFEASTKEFQEYALQVVVNARVLAEELMKYGWYIVSWWTDTHLFLVDVWKSFGISWKQAQDILESVGITVNKNMVPYDRKTPQDPSGIRIGTAAVTTRGMKERDMQTIAQCIHEALLFAHDGKKLQAIQETVQYLCAQYPIYV